MRKTYKYKAQINKKTEANLLNWLELCRQLYNCALEQRIKIYKEYGKSISCFDQMKQVTDMRKEFQEYRLINAQVLGSIIDRLDKSYKSFFRRVKNNEKAGFPRFKSFNRYDSFTLRQNGYKLDNRNLYITGIGRLKLFLSRPIEGRIKTVTIKRNSIGKWFVYFSCDEVPRKSFPKPTKRDVGLDVGIKYFLTDSDGNIVENPHCLKNSSKLLRKLQRSLSRKQKRSNRRRITKLQVAKLHEHISNQRLDFINKIVLSYVNQYKTIYIEDLKISNMIRNNHLSKSIGDVSWGIFFDKLLFKAEEAGREVVKVKPHNTSQICSCCGQIVPKKLSERIHNCPYCNISIDRDLNAAINILQRGRVDHSGANSSLEELSENLISF